MKSSSEQRKENIMAFTQLATLGLTALGMAEIMPMFFAPTNYGFSTEATPDLILGEATGKVLDRVSWIKVACGASMLPVIYEATKRIPKSVGVPNLKEGSWLVPIGQSHHKKWVFHDFNGIAHALGGGSTGSGKTQFVKSCMYVLCQQQPPERLKFIVIDLKEGASFADWENCPHVQSVYYDVKSARAGLKEAHDIMTERLQEVRECRRKFKPMPNYSRLMVVIDEGSLLSDDDESMDMLRDLVSIGREPKVNIWYNSQRPSHEILPTTTRDQMEARFALKLTEPGSSEIMLGPNNLDAFKLKARPGRMIYRGRNQQVELQAINVPNETIEAWLRGYAENAMSPIDAPHSDTRHEGKQYSMDSPSQVATSESACTSQV